MEEWELSRCIDGVYKVRPSRHQPNPVVSCSPGLGWVGLVMVGLVMVGLGWFVFSVDISFTMKTTKKFTSSWSLLKLGSRS